MEELDIFAIFIRSLAAFWWAIPLILLVGLFETSWFKGKLGEYLVMRAFKRRLNPEIYHVLHDVTLPTAHGSTQIDHLVISPFGVFVVETKNMGGWIFGSVENKKWTQTFYRRKFSFQNPLRQNFKHIMAIAEVTGLDKSKIHSLVIFLGNAKFKTDMPPNVARRAGGVSYIKSFNQVLLTEQEVSAALSAIGNVRFSPGIATNRKHIQSLEERHREPICSRCGSAMVKRRAKNGAQGGSQFWGCSTFPKCRYTKDI